MVVVVKEGTGHREITRAEPSTSTRRWRAGTAGALVRARVPESSKGARNGDRTPTFENVPAVVVSTSASPPSPDVLGLLSLSLPLACPFCEYPSR